MSALRPAVFLDRDGTLMEEVNYCSDPALVRVFPCTGDALRELNCNGFLCVIITNQAGIGRGYFTETQYQAVQAELIRQIDGGAAPSLVAATYFCPDAPSTPSARRKPEPGMVLEAARDLGIDLARSWFVGDKRADVECGQRAGTRTVLVETGYGCQEVAAGVSPNFIAKDIVAAVALILQNKDASF
ncbi:MAG: D-glycero-alpha-D-manno-heptose-1,7-bisphosphate 7-phosphatase [Chthoniobacteraceae bacterium]